MYIVISNNIGLEFCGDILYFNGYGATIFNTFRRAEIAIENTIDNRKDLRSSALLTKHEEFHIIKLKVRN